MTEKIDLIVCESELCDCRVLFVRERDIFVLIGKTKKYVYNWYKKWYID